MQDNAALRRQRQFSLEAFEHALSMPLFFSATLGGLLGSQHNWLGQYHLVSSNDPGARLQFLSPSLSRGASPKTLSNSSCDGCLKVSHASIPVEEKRKLMRYTHLTRLSNNPSSKKQHG